MGDALSVIMLLDKFRMGRDKTSILHLLSEYVEKQELQNPENYNKLVYDAIRIFLEKSGHDKEEINHYLSIIEKAKDRGYKGMFEAAIESIIEDRKEALSEQAREIAQNLLRLGYPIKDIVAATGIDEETVSTLQK